MASMISSDLDLAPFFMSLQTAFHPWNWQYAPTDKTWFQLLSCQKDQKEHWQCRHWKRSYSSGCGSSRKTLCRQLETVSGKFPKLTKIFQRNKGTSDKIKFVKVGNPFRILFFCFLAFNSFDILRMCKADINVIFEIIKNRNPILSGGFQTNMIAIILDKPVMKLLNIRIDSWKGFLIIFRYSVFIGSYDGCNDNIFVDIKSTADGVF